MEEKQTLRSQGEPESERKSEKETESETETRRENEVEGHRKREAKGRKTTVEEDTQALVRPRCEA